MTDVLKVLGQAAPTDTSETALYTAPNLAQTTVSSVTVCNRTSSGLTFKIAVKPAAAAVAIEHYIFFDTPLAGNSTLTAVLGLTLAQTDVITVFASATGLTFNLYGVETS